MIPADLASRLRELVQGTVQAIAATPAVESELPAFERGQRFTAQIQNPLPDGSYKALVAGRTITLALPEMAKDGDVLELVVTGRDADRITARQADTPDATAPRAGETAAKPSLSQTAQLISQLLTGRFSGEAGVPLAQGRPLVTPPAVPPGAAPDVPRAPLQAASTPAQIFAAAPVTPHALAAARMAAELAPVLRQAVAQSGLFYEAHQARWLEGSLATDSLLQEPQARAGEAEAARARMAAPDLRATPTARAAPDAASTKPAGDAPHNMRAPLTGIEATQAGETGPASRAAPRIPESMMPLVHQQLETLATQQVMWSGQVWPGQTMQWTVDDPRDGQGHGAQDGDTPEWRSSLHLTLPRLGGVDAQLVLTPAGLAVRIAAQDEDAATRLREGAPLLEAALAAAGISLTGMAVNHESRDGATP